MRPTLLLAARVLTFATSPARDPDPELLTAAIAPAATLTSTALTARSCVDRGEVRTVRACTLEQIAIADASGDFVAPPRREPDAAPDPAAEASAYYHAARARAFFEGLAGTTLPNAVDVVAGLRLPTALREGNRALAARPEATLDAFPFAFYLRAGENPAFDALFGTTRSTVWLGRGRTRDLALDGTVVAHEMTHAMLDGVLHARGFRASLHGASAEPAATSEALADYFAAAVNGTPFIGEWASGEIGAAYRALDAFVACPDAIDGRVYRESLLLSSALWAVRARVEPRAFDAALYRALGRTPARSDLGFADVAAALELEDPRAATWLRTELERRAVGCAPVFDLAEPLRGGFHAPGTDALDVAGIAPGVLQLRVDLPAGVTRLRIDFDAVAALPPLFGAARSPFAPVVLVSWDAPLRWDGARSNAALETPASGGAVAHAELDVAAGARVAYLQIANRGQSDGAYDYVTVTMTSEAPFESPAAIAAGGSGCAIGRARRRGGYGGALVAALAILLTAVRSRAGTCRRRSSAGTSPPRSSPSSP